MASLYDWSSTAANNATADGDINWAEGQNPNTVNDSARQMMKRTRDLLTDIAGATLATGTANGLLLTAANNFTTLATGRIVCFRAALANTGAATLNVNGIGAKSIRYIGTAGDAAIAAGTLQEDGIYVAIYGAHLNSSAGGWMLLNPTSTIAEASLPPVGSIMDFAGSSAPSGWLFCYGQAVSRTTYSALFTAIGTTYGAGDESTTFNLPDLRGRVVAGQDDMGGTSANRLTDQTGGLNGVTLGATGGAETVTLTASQMPSHTHTGTTAAGGAHGHPTRVSTTVEGSFGSNGSGGFPLTTVDDATFGANTGSAGTAAGDQIGVSSTHTHTFTTASAGSGSAHGNIQPTIILNKIIRAGV